MNSLPTSASFLVTENCNLSCKYCYGLEGRNTSKMTPDIIRKGLEYLCDNALKGKEKSFSAMIFGGEPLLEPDLVELILEYGCFLADKHQIKFTANMVTNATIFSAKIRDIVLKYKNKAQFAVQLSIDGIQEVQDMYRVKNDGTGSFSTIEKNIDNWKEVFKNDMGKLSVHGCCNKKSLPFLYQNYLFFKETWGIERIWFMPIHSETWDDSDVKIYEEELSKIKNYIMNKVKENNNIHEVQHYAPIDRCLRGDKRADHPCGAGRGFITITSKGDIWPCHHFYLNDPEKTLLIGNIWNGIDDAKRKIFLDYENCDMLCAKKDSTCDAFHCYRCIADNWVINGSILSQIMGPRCEMSKIERKIQVEIKEEIKKMGLLNSACTGHQDACRCNLGEPRGWNACQCNLGGPPPLDKEDGDQIAQILKVVLDKLQNLEDAQKRIEEKLTINNYSTLSKDK